MIFDNDSFVIYYELFNLKLRKKEGKISEINYFDILNTGRKAFKKIFIDAGDKKHNCLVQLSDYEEQTMRQEIKDWLYI